MEKGTFISSVFGGPVEEYYLGKNSWSAVASDWKQRFEVGDAIIDPAGDWDPSSAETYIDSQIAIVTSDLASETLARQAGDAEAVKTVTQTLSTSQKDIANANLENKDATNGMARIVLKASDNFKSVVEAQTEGNTIFVIRYDFILTGNVTIPPNCMLEFDGGSINGAHTLTGQNTAINAGLVKIFDTNVLFAGTWKLDASYLEWFGSSGVNTEDATAFLTSAYSLYNSVCLVKSYYLPNGFTLSTGGFIYSKQDYASIKIGAPIKIVKSYTKIHRISIQSTDRENINCFILGEEADSPDCYNVEIVSCLIQSVKTAFTVNNWTANLFIEKCVINGTNHIIDTNTMNISNTRFNICIKDSITYYTNYFGKITQANLNCTDCYFGVTGNTFYFSGSWSDVVFFTRCSFELARECSSDTPIQLFYIQGVYKFVECSFVSNKATNFYWFGGGQPTSFELDNCRFADFSLTNKISGLFIWTGFNEKYGHYKIKDLRYGITLVNRPQDYGGSFGVGEQFYGYFDFVGRSGTCIYCGDNGFDVSKMKDGCIYKIYEKNPNGDYLYSVVKNNNHVLKFSERSDAGLTHVSKVVSRETVARSIGFSLYNANTDRPSNYVEYSGGAMDISSFRNQTKYINNTCVQGSEYLITLYPNLISGYDTPYLSAKICKSNTNDSDDDITLNLIGVAGNGVVCARFTAPNNSVYPYIKLVSTAEVAYISGNIIKIEKGFLEADGEISGISRSGTFANVPIPRHKGFAYFATDKGTAGVGAMIYYTGNNTTPWVYADGTAVS